MNIETAEGFFAQLCSEGRGWINLAGDAPKEEWFLISIEYSYTTGHSGTAVNVPGPSLFKDKPRTESFIIIED